MNDLCTDIGFRSLAHSGEELCGDHVETVTGADGRSEVLVLADGLGSGVRASILSTLTAKILATMMAAGMGVGECVETIAKTLPVTPASGVAYSTFSAVQIIDSRTALLVQYDNPEIILFRDGAALDYPKTLMAVGDKRIYRSSLPLKENDVFLVMSDGCPYAGSGTAYNFGWQRQDIADFLGPVTLAGLSAGSLVGLLMDKVNELYGGKPGDDATAAVIRIRRRQPLNILFGPPANRDDEGKMLALFFSKEGRHIVAGGTTAKLAARYLGQELEPGLDSPDPAIPPTASLTGADLVTEGVITMNRVAEDARAALAAGTRPWENKQDGASLIAGLLFDEATDINFFVGKAINPAHQNPELPISFSIKMNIVKDLAGSLEKMGKRVIVSYF